MENVNVNSNDAKKVAMIIIAMFTDLNGSKFIGATYRNKNNELSKYVLIANFNYGVAVAKTIEILNSLNEADFLKIAEKYNVNNVAGIQYSNNADGKLYLETGKLPKEGTKARVKVLESIKITKTLMQIRNEMVNAFVNNKDEETRSASSEAQIEAYEKIVIDGKTIPSMKVCKATNNVHIYAMAHSREVIEAGTYSNGEKWLETAQKDAITSYCKYVLNAELPTAKYRNMIITTDQLFRIKANGTELVKA